MRRAAPPMRAGAKDEAQDRKRAPHDDRKRAPKDAPQGAAAGGKPYANKPHAAGPHAKPFAKPQAKRVATPEPAKKAYEGERVAKAMARAGACSRRDAEKWIEEGRVAVNGRRLATPAFNVRESDAITVDGAPMKERERTRLFLFHKPAGLVVSARDPEGRDTVFDFLNERFPDLPRLVSVGRLDINTEGLLLLTNDGGLARTLELPATGWTRRYRVRAHGAVDQRALDALKGGVEIEGVAYAPIEATLDRVQGANAWLTLTLTEGKNREVKRVLEHIGLDVNRLIRLSFGPFQLGELAEGVVEEVRLKVLREQLGKGLAELAGVDFSSPLRDAPASTATPGTPSQRQRKHVTELRRERDERVEKGPRQRVLRGATADRSGRAVTVERIASTKPKADTDTRNGRRFSALRRADDGERTDTRTRAPAPHDRRRDGGVERPRDAERPARREGREDGGRFERPRSDKPFAPRSPRGDADGERRFPPRDASAGRDARAGGGGREGREAREGREPRRFDGKPREERRFDAKPRDGGRDGARSQGPRAAGGGAGGGFRKFDGGRAAGGPGAGRPSAGRPRDDRPRDDRPRDERPRSDRPRDERPRDGRPGAGRPAAGRPRDDKPRDGRPGGGKPRDGKPHDGRPGDDRPRSGRPGGGKPGGGKLGGGRPGGGKPRGGKPGGGRPPGGKPGGGKPRGDRPPRGPR